MTLRLRFLLDTNVLIPLQDSLQVLEGNLANFVRLAHVGGHQLMYHPANIADFERDQDPLRRGRNLQRIKAFPALSAPAACPWNDPRTSPNDACDNELLFALHCDAVHALVSEDKGLHAKARQRGLSDRIYTIQTAEDWLQRLHEPRRVVLPNIEDLPMHSLTPDLASPFFTSLRQAYPATTTEDGFDKWFRSKAREGRQGWVYRDDRGGLGALCIYQVQHDEVCNDRGDVLVGPALKLCTFKVGELVRGRKIGELFLKAAFRYATENACEHIFITARAEAQDYLIRMLQDFGFAPRGQHHDDVVLVKEHPTREPAKDGLSPLDFARRYFPHFRSDATVQKFLVPVQPRYHDILFPDFLMAQRRLFSPSGHVGNAIRLAYLCHAPVKSIQPGDVVLFYRTDDEKTVTTIGVVDRFEPPRESRRLRGVSYAAMGNSESC